MNVRKMIGVLMIVCLSGVFLVSYPTSSFSAPKAIEWKLISSWGTEYLPTRVFLVPVVNKVNERAAGRLKITWFGPEAVPTFEQLKPVREGIFDVLWTHPAYHMGEIAVGNAIDLIPFSPKEKRDAGLYKIVDEAYRKKQNCTYIGTFHDNVGYHLMINKKIDKADLHGFKIRSTPFYDPFIIGLGASTVQTKHAEIYSSLEKGVVDGAIMSAFGALDYKWYEVVKNQVRPRLGEMVLPVIVNLNSWNKLPKDLQDIFTQTVAEFEAQTRDEMSKIWEKEEKELVARGMLICQLPPKEVEKYVSVFYEKSWEGLVLKRDPEFGPRIKEIADKMKKK